MNAQYIFDFKKDISSIEIPTKLNNPFSDSVSQIANIAAEEFQDFISEESKFWKYDFNTQKGKMFGVLVVQQKDHTYCYLGTISGKLSRAESCDKFVPTVFDDSVGDYFINKGMTELSEIRDQIKSSTDLIKIKSLREKSKNKSIGLQKRLFENYSFLNFTGIRKNLIEIFEESSHARPPSGAGECAAPKLLHYAIEHGLKPIALTEFWWGNSDKKKERLHKSYYPACKDKCRPILEYMLEDQGLFERR